tara:strand:- start:16 stop:567 length:552 start_codon:yes stop_codon:yes gene_type:complete
MKKIIIISLFTLSLALISPNYLSAKVYDQVTFEEVQNIRKGSTKSYITARGEEFNVGDTITLGYPRANECYDYIIQMPLGGAMLTTYPLCATSANATVEIKKINFRKGMTGMKTTKPEGMVYMLSIMNIDAALDTGEVVSSILTRSQAIAKLKESKDLLDLDLMTESEYNTIKAELTPIIKGN